MKDDMTVRHGFALLLGLLLLITGCSREVIWLNRPSRSRAPSPFALQVEGVRHPVHGLIEREALRGSGRVRILYREKAVKVFREYDRAYVSRFWATERYIYVWFSVDPLPTLATAVVGRFNSTGRFELCSDITPLDDRFGSLDFGTVVNDTTFWLYRGSGSCENGCAEPSYLLVEFSDCHPVDVDKWLKAFHNGPEVWWPPRATPVPPPPGLQRPSDSLIEPPPAVSPAPVANPQ